MLESVELGLWPKDATYRVEYIVGDAEVQNAFFKSIVDLRLWYNRMLADILASDLAFEIDHMYLWDTEQMVIDKSEHAFHLGIS